MSKKVGRVVSVVVCAAKHDQNLTMTLESVLASKGNFELEVIVVVPGVLKTEEISPNSVDGRVVFVRDSGKGVYPALNIGVEESTGDFLAIVHAGDRVSPGYISALLEQASPGVVTYSDRMFGGSLQRAAESIDGLSLYHKFIIHNTFILFRMDFVKVGGFDESLAILADQDWIRRARVAGLRFHKVAADGENYYMAGGGISTAKGQEERDAFKAEWAQFTSRQYPFLAQDISWDLYEYRFNEATLKPIFNYVRNVVSSDAEDLKVFVTELGHAFTDIWARRPLPWGTADAFRRLAFCDLLSINKSLTNVTLANLGGDFAELSALVLQTNSACDIHVVPIYGAPTETFISDTIYLRAQTGVTQIVLCEKKSAKAALAAGANSELIKVFEIGKFSSRSAKQAMGYVLEIGEPRTASIHWLTAGLDLVPELSRGNHSRRTLLMAYGIDVTNLERDQEATLKLVRGLVSRVDVFVVSSSNHLKERLEAIGFPENKLRVIFPSVSMSADPGVPRGPMEKNRERGVALVNLGRLVPFKRQEDIIEAMAILEKRGIKATLAILAGDRLDRKRVVLERARRLGLEERVEVLDYASREQVKEILENADVLVSAAKGTVVKNSIHTETFGVAIAEALTSGLPVVVSEAGGQKEVVGDFPELARLYSAGDVQELAEALENSIENYPSLRLREQTSAKAKAKFGPDRRASELSNLLDIARQASPRVAHFSKTAWPGAGLGAFRLHEAMLESGIDSTFFSLAGREDLHQHIYSLKGALGVRHPRPFPGETIFSVDASPVFDAVENRYVFDEFDVFLVHMVRDFLSIKDIEMLAMTGKPVFVVVRDYAVLSGGCHFPGSCQKWKSNCIPCVQWSPRTHFDLPLIQQDARSHLYSRDNVTAVFLSDAHRSRAEDARVLQGAKTVCIGNVPPPQTALPISHEDARERFGIPGGRKTVGVFAMYSASVKGHDWLRENLAKLVDSCSLVLVGDPFQDYADVENVRWLPQQTQPELLALMQTLDVVLVPSMDETFGNTAVEAVLAGAWVVGGNVGVIPQLAEIGLAEVAEPEHWPAVIEAHNPPTRKTREVVLQRLHSAGLSRELVVRRWIEEIDKVLTATSGSFKTEASGGGQLDRYRSDFLIRNSQGVAKRLKLRTAVEKAEQSKIGGSLKKAFPGWLNATLKKLKAKL